MSAVKHFFIGLLEKKCLSDILFYVIFLFRHSLPSYLSFSYGSVQPNIIGTLQRKFDVVKKKKSPHECVHTQNKGACKHRKC